MKRRKSAVGRILALLGVLILVLIAVVMVKTYTYPFDKNSETRSREMARPELSEKSARRFSGGIRIPTVSTEVYSETNFEPFERFKAYLPEQYPEIYRVMDTMTVNTYGLVFRWKGKNPSLAPILLLSHYDVVPVLNHDPQTEPEADSVYRFGDQPAEPIGTVQNDWEYPPFSGAVVNGRIYGRGTLDMKGMLFGILEAADALIAEGFQPERDVWFAFGQDEEVGGRNGALKIAEYFAEQGMTFDAVYDEGSFVLAPGVAGIDRPMALIGAGEKGFLTLRIKVRGIGGHSSMPPREGSLVKAAEIIEKLNDNQFPARIIPPIQSFLNHVGGEMNFASRMAISNQWLLRPLLLKNLEKTPPTNALVRTTTAITMAQGSDAANVLASVSEVTVNFRILQGESVADVMDHVNKICEGYDVEIETVNAREPSNISPEDTEGYRIVERTINKLYPEAIVSSYITIGGTDSYKYQNVSDHIYRFMPIYLNTYEQGTIHNENEHISFENFARMIAYFKEIMQNYGNE